MLLNLQQIYSIYINLNKNRGVGVEMDFAYTPEQESLIDLCRQFMKKEVTPFVEQYEQDEHYPRETAEKLGSIGLTGGTIPEEYGGAGLDYITLSIVLEELAYGDIMTATIAGWPSCSLGRPLLVYGTEEQKQTYLKPLAQGRMFGATGVTEPHSGTDIVRRMETTVRKEGDHYILNGMKTWVSNAKNADFFLTYGTLDKSKGMHGICAFIVEKKWPGVTINKIKNKVGARSQDTAEVYFEDVKVPKENLIGEEGKGYKALMCGTEIGRLACASRAVGQMRACLDAAVQYASEREVFGQPIGKYQLIQAKIANMRLSIESARLMNFKLAWLFDQGHERCQKEASLAKWYATDALMKVAEDAYQIHGAYGVAEEYKVGRYFRDAKIMQIYDGANEIHQQIVGEWELGYRTKK